jgi:hypothetical protein
MNKSFKAVRILVIFTVLFLNNACSAKEQNNEAGYNANDQIRPGEVGTNQNIMEKETAISEIPDESNGGLPEIIGTSWSLLCIYEKGTQPKYLRIFPEYLFCKNGRWELLSLTHSQGQMGTYTINGNRLKTVHDGVDKLTENYKMIFRLRYRTKTKC